MKTTTIDAQLRARIDAFVADISAAVRASALDAVREALGSPAPAKHGPGRSPKTDASPASAKRRGKRGKRTPEDVAKMGEAVVAYVAKNPGQSVEQIKKALGVEKKDLQLPIVRMVADEEAQDDGAEARDAVLREVGELRADATAVAWSAWRSQRPSTGPRSFDGSLGVGGKLRTPAMQACIATRPLTLREIFLWQRSTRRPATGPRRRRQGCGDHAGRPTTVGATCTLDICQLHA